MSKAAIICFIFSNDENVIERLIVFIYKALCMSCSTSIRVYVLLYECMYYYTSVCTIIRVFVLLYEWLYYYTSVCTIIRVYVLLYECMYYYTSGCTIIRVFVLLYECMYYYTNVCTIYMDHSKYEYVSKYIHLF